MRSSRLVGAPGALFAVTCALSLALNAAPPARQAEVVYEPCAPFEPPPPLDTPTNKDAALGVSFDGELVAHTYNDRLLVLDAELNERQSFAYTKKASRIVFSSDRSSLLVGDTAGGLACFDLVAKKMAWEVEVDQKIVRSIDVSPDLKLVAAASPSKVVVVGLKDGKTVLTESTAGTDMMFREASHGAALFLGRGKMLAILEKKEVRFLPIPRGGAGKSSRVPLEGVLNGFALDGDGGLCVSTLGGLFRVAPGKKPQKLATDAAMRFVFYFHPFGRDKLIIVTNDEVLETSRREPGKKAVSLSKIVHDFAVFSPRGPWMYDVVQGAPGVTVLRRIALVAEQPLFPSWFEAIRKSNVIYRVGFAPDGRGYWLFWTTDMGALEKIGPNKYKVKDDLGPFSYGEWRFPLDADKGERIYETRCYGPVFIGRTHLASASARGGNLQIVERASGKTFQVPAGGGVLAGATADGAFLIVTDTTHPGRYTLVDAKKGTVLGAWDASSAKLLAATSKGEFVVRVVEEKASGAAAAKEAVLLCHPPKGKAEWRQKLEGSPDRLELSPGGESVLCGRLLLETATGREITRLDAPARFAECGDYLLVDAAPGVPARLIDSKKGNTVGRLASSTIGNGDAAAALQIVSVSKDARWLIVRRGDSNRVRDYWFYQRAGKQ